jgi:hypothetical protein
MMRRVGMAFMIVRMGEARRLGVVMCAGIAGAAGALIVSVFVHA